MRGTARDLPDLDALERAQPSPLQAQAAALAQRFDPTVIPAGGASVYGGRQAVKAYATGFWEAVLTVLPHLQGPHSSLDQVLAHLAAARGALARGHDAPHAEQFGAERGDFPLQTAVVGYRQVPGVRAFFARLRSGEALRQLPDCLVAAEGGPRVVHALEGVRVGLTQYASFSRRHALRHYGGYTGAAMALLPALARQRWDHAVDDPQGRVDAHLEALFQAARAPLSARTPAAQHTELCRRVGALHWWLSHVCRYERGSAAITDMLSTALFELHGLHRGRWKPQIMADVVALITPRLDDFVGMYEGLLRSPAGLQKDA